MENNRFVSAVVVAAGSSVRMGGTDKMTLEIEGIPVLARSLLAFQKCRSISEIVVVTRSASFGFVAEIRKKYGITKISEVVEGGSCRFDSVMNGLAAVSEKADFVAIHDGARPLVEPADIAKCAEDAFCFGGAILAVPVTDTIKVTDPAGFTDDTPPREKLFAAQTPQIFEINMFKKASEEAAKISTRWTDDSAVFENYGRKVFLTSGSRDNMKITSPEDIEIAEAFLKRKEKH